MKKNIVNNIEKKLDEKLSCFTFKGEKEYEVKKEECSAWYTLSVYSPANFPICGVTIESVQEVIKPYLKKYNEDMFYGLENIYMWDDKKKQLKSVPCISINMRKEAE